MKRRIIQIDEAKCDGCGICVNACHEGAIELVAGKARLVSDIYCDGLGDCIGDCPRGAITFTEREAEAYDETAVTARQTKATSPDKRTGGCPGMAALAFAEKSNPPTPDAPPASGNPSALQQWPVQLSLVPVTAPYWKDADILVAADCAPCACGDFHNRLLRGRKLIIACPKLDDTSRYAEKLAAIVAGNDVKSVMVAHMEVPCCNGIVRLVQEALAAAGKPIATTRVKIGIHGNILETETLTT